MSAGLWALLGVVVAVQAWMALLLVLAVIETVAELVAARRRKW